MDSTEFEHGLELGAGVLAWLITHSQRYRAKGLSVVAVRSDVLFNNTTVPGSGIHLVTVPNGQTWIIKHVSLTDNGGLANLGMSLHILDAVNEGIAFDGTSDALGQLHGNGLFIVAKQGAVLILAKAPSPNNTNVFICGVRLQGVAS